VHETTRYNQHLESGPLSDVCSGSVTVAATALDTSNTGDHFRFSLLGHFSTVTQFMLLWSAAGVAAAARVAADAWTLNSRLVQTHALCGAVCGAAPTLPCASIIQYVMVAAAAGVGRNGGITGESGSCVGCRCSRPPQQ